MRYAELNETNVVVNLIEAEPDVIVELVALLGRRYVPLEDTAGPHGCQVQIGDTCIDVETAQFRPST